MRVRVVCGLEETMATFCPRRRLRIEDLPTFGRPTIAMKADLVSGMAILLQIGDQSPM